MIASPLSRRALVGGLISAAVLSGCSLSSPSSTVDGEAADRQRLTRARDLSQQLILDIQMTVQRHPHLAETLSRLQALHSTQIAQFIKAAKLPSPPASTMSGMLLTTRTVNAREQALIEEFRKLALQADRGDVAALLASAAAGIDQALVGPTR